MQEMQVHFPSLGWEDPLEKENGKPFQYLCLKNSMDKRSLVGYSPWTLKQSDVTEHTHNSFPGMLEAMEFSYDYCNMIKGSW